MPRKALTDRSAPTLPAAGVGWLLTRPGCPTASVWFGAKTKWVHGRRSIRGCLRPEVVFIVEGTTVSCSALCEASRKADEGTPPIRIVFSG